MDFLLLEVTMRSSFLAFAAMIGFVAACTVAKAEVDVQNMCLTYDDLMITGVAGGSNELDHTFKYSKLGLIQAFASRVTNLQFVSVTAQATSGITSLDFVQAAHVSVASGDPTSPLPTVDVYDCDGDCVPDGNSLNVPATFEASAIAYVETGSIVANLVIDGAIPPQDWTMDIDFCFSGQLSYSRSLR
jgi:hypothetical protein